MNADEKLGRNPVSKHHIQPEYGDEQADTGRDCEPVSRDQILRHERGQGNVNVSCSADHVQDWQTYPVDPYSCYMCDHTWRYELFPLTLEIRLHLSFNLKHYRFIVDHTS